jgi:asparagine synthetase B (glutamine-hydrolysing)
MGKPFTGGSPVDLRDVWFTDSSDRHKEYSRMCGIYGSLRFTPEERRLDLVAHRGPDGRGWRVVDTPAGPLALGHRRLAIIDTTQGADQPMRDESGRFTIVFNGEIYNYKELAQELAQKGKTFRTHSDTEVLLTAYEVWGAGVSGTLERDVRLPHLRSPRAGAFCRP